MNTKAIESRVSEVTATLKQPVDVAAGITGQTQGEDKVDVSRPGCPACSEPKSSPESKNFRRCPSCGLIYRAVFNRVAGGHEWDQKYYSDELVMQYYDKRQSAFRQMVQIIDQLAPDKDRWLDIGCGLGWLLQVAHDDGWRKVCGIEFSQLCVARARQRMQFGQIVEGSAEDNLPRFSDVTVTSFVDSLRFCQEPAAILTGVHSALSKEGWVMIREVNADTLAKSRANEKLRSSVSFRDSLQYWNPQALENMLRILGFRNVHSMPSPTFTETAQGERRHTKSGYRVTMEKLVRRGIYPMARLAHNIAPSDLFLRPNFIAFGQK